MAKQFASEKLRLESFSSWTRLTPMTHRQLALAGFVAQTNECSCLECPVKISLDEIDENCAYSPSYFRQLHRKRIAQRNQHCPFLLCQLGTNIGDLRQSSAVDWSDAEYPEFHNREKRRETFRSWPYRAYQNTHLTADLLAERGFFFTDSRDAVTCFYCGNTLHNWTRLLHSTNERLVQLEHARFFPCRFILSFTGDPFVKEAELLHPVGDEERRLRNPIRTDDNRWKKPENLIDCRSTFETWPENAPVSSEELVHAGFFYLGHAFRVQCHVCDLLLDDGLFPESPLVLHRQRNAQCEFLQAIDSTKYGDAHCVDEKWRLETLNETLPLIEKVRQELAACGFFAAGKTPTIRCAYCGVTIKPNLDQSIMSQHRCLMKNSTTIDCPMVRAQCPTNRPIADRAPFPENHRFRTVFARRQSFKIYQDKYHVNDAFVEERVYAGFFLENLKRMRCFQCGNALPIQSKRLQTEFPQYDAAKLHAHFYPTCEWLSQILGPKYVAQVFLDRKNSNRIENPFSFASISTTSEASSFPSPAISVTSPSLYDMSDYADDSDDDNFQTVARPFGAHFTSVLSPSPSPAPSSDQSPSVAVQPTTDNLNSGETNHSLSPIVPLDNHPFRNLALQATPPISPVGALTPADLRQTFASEINRLETFREHNRTEFARLSVEELAYVGFYLNADGGTVQCPWCDVKLTEKRFESILRRRPILPDSPLNDDPWTAMRVHRHAIGQLTDQVNSYCPWVRRIKIGVYLNQMNPRNALLYPEYPLYQSVEKRIASFNSTWPFPDGTRLSKQLMADAGFIHFDQDQVICFYCGNALREFKPRDCPFEEHATASPLCDFIIAKFGQKNIDDLLGDIDLIPEAKQRTDIQGTEKIKTILYPPSRLTPKKLNRQRVQRMASAPDKPSPALVSSVGEVRSMSINEELFEELCLLCCDRAGSHVYQPCRHFPMCLVCVAQLTDEERKECFACKTPSTISLK